MSTNKFAVLGSPIDHSKSPLLHNASYQYLALGGSYDRVEVTSGNLASYLRNNGSEYDAFSITMPLKVEAFECAQIHDEISTRIQVANTLIWTDGVWKASNTDVLGFYEIFKRDCSSLLERPMVLGSGSTAKSAVLALEMLGVRSLEVMARSESAATELRNLFPKIRISLRSWGGHVSTSSLVISAVPEVEGITFDNDVSHFIDVTYKDLHPKILNSITAKTFTYISGLHLLVYQAAHQVLQMRNVHADRFEEIVKVMFAALDNSN